MTPENRKLVLSLGVVFLLGGVASIASGVTYFRGTIARAEEPTSFWTNVACLFVLGIFLTIGGIVAK